MSLSRIFDISRRSLATYQKALDATAHNVANSANSDFTRRRVVLTADTPEYNAGIVWGTGVKMTDIQRLRDSFADNQIRSNSQKSSDSDRQAQLLGQIEKAFTEPSDQGLSNAISAFFNSWSSLAVNPGSIPLRNNLLNSANLMSNKIKNIHDDLQLIQDTTVKDFASKVGELNTALSNIQNLNRQIYESKVMGSSSADLEDQRDKLIDQISKIANIAVNYDDGGSANVSVGGVLAADRFNFTTFEMSSDNGKLALMVKDAGIAVTLRGGELNALTEVYSKKIPEYQSKLDTIVNTLMTSVNTIHKKGTDISTPSQGGLNFFDGYSQGLLTINSSILNDSRKIAVSADGTSGNGDIANEIADLLNAKTVNGTTFLESYSNLVGQIANEKSSQENKNDASNLAIEQMEQIKSSTSGVSIDEEMTNMIRYQRSYDASAKLIKTADELLQTLIGMIS